MFARRSCSWSASSPNRFPRCASRAGAATECVALVLIPTYNERENLPLLVAACCGTPDVPVLVVDDGSPDGTGQIADASLARSGAARRCMHRTGGARPRAARTSTACARAWRPVPTSRLPDGRRPVARPGGPAAAARGRQRGRPGHRLALRPGRRVENWPRAPAVPERVRQQVHPRHHRTARARLHQRLPLLAARALARLPLDRHPLGRLRLPGRDDLGGKPGWRHASRKSRSASSNGGAGVSKMSGAA